MKALSWHYAPEIKMFWIRFFGWGLVIESSKNRKSFSERYGMQCWRYFGPLKWKRLTR